MAISVVAPISPAIEHTKQVLFRPIALGKWFVLGFCAWLAQLGEGGGGFNFQVRVPGPIPGPGPAQNPAQVPGPAPPPAPPDRLQQAMDWVQANLGLVIGIVVAVVLVGVAIGLLLTWLRSRGTFLFLDGVAR